ncbi:MAG TPA: lysophospholipid acyltransferase family protein [Blastocatellia bacterium]|nr:lysophospholipid acyltransferase family protein [Blastocatellia bacterium]
MLLRLLKSIGWPVFRVLFAVEYHGVENVPERGSVIIAGNHPSYLDPVLVLLPVKRKIRFMAWDALFKVPVLGQLIHAFGAFPVDVRKGRGESAFREALNVLNNGDALGIFPEGQRSEQGPMGELRTGVARLAIETGAAIVPVTIGGAYRAWPKWKLLPKPAKIIVRYHEPVQLHESDRLARRDDKEFHQQVMQQVAERINRSLTPSLRVDDAYERWYSQPPSNIRSYEWAPLIALIVTVLVSIRRNTIVETWLGVLLPAMGYYLYLMADLALIKPARLSKWIRNTMPVWLILIWHFPLCRALAVPSGERNPWLVVAALAALFPFFYEHYFTLQKFVRGLVASYYFSMALMLLWPHGLGTLVAVLGFIAVFVLWFEVTFRWLIAAVMLAVIAAAIWLTELPQTPLLIYSALALVMIAYLQTFVSFAYDIRKAGDVSLK